MRATNNSRYLSSSIGPRCLFNKGHGTIEKVFRVLVAAFQMPALILQQQHIVARLETAYVWKHAWNDRTRHCCNIPSNGVDRRSASSNDHVPVHAVVERGRVPPESFGATSSSDAYALLQSDVGLHRKKEAPEPKNHTCNNALNMTRGVRCAFLGPAAAASFPFEDIASDDAYLMPRAGMPRSDKTPGPSNVLVGRGT
ncbi:hypothetical protein NA56DRAFT_704089 [Hyaloscypha hepaticicola]|uniref:Uncharacterized protein n=1 Tax=Hyaloscypha hepaticicola TaxID=2082293 RepID=A0A2J6Q3J4_9HELO|nr:hypothetical protein NA56DRAFT_704089 [Hyaloscypha hepaticicola]